jgi:hypothetical protein
MLGSIPTNLGRWPGHQKEFRVFFFFFKKKERFAAKEKKEKKVMEFFRKFIPFLKA